MVELTDHSALPTSVLRPLWGTAAAILCFLAIFLVWAVFAPLATTLQFSGKIISARPTYELQHPFGGSVAEVFVERHDQIEAGQTVLSMDVSLEATQLRTLRETLADYEQENRVIETLLQDQAVPSATSDLGVGWSHIERARQAGLQINQQRTKADNLIKQEESLLKKIAITEQQLAVMQARQNRQNTLADNGHVSESDREVLSEQILILRAEIEGDRASLISTQGQAVTAMSQADLIGISLREQLLRTRDANTKRLQDIHQKVAVLQQKLDESIVRSPVTGTVANIYFMATGTYAARGATLMSLTQPLDKPFVTFEIPVSQVDQIEPGMKGRLMLTSLPHRSMPKIDASIVAISPRANLNELGVPVSYTGRADLQPNALEKIIAATSNARLVEDMPVQLLIEARRTTLAGYIYRPFVEGIRTAVQD